MVSKREPAFDLLSLLDRLEDIREEMLDLGVTTIEDIEARIRDLESRLDDTPDGNVDGSL
jgi:hypothetical protein